MTPDEMFPDNRSMAEARLKNLTKRYSRDKKCHKDYTRFMEDMICKGYIENHSSKFNRAKLGLPLIMVYIIQASQVKYVSYLIGLLSVMEYPLLKT